MLPTGIITFLFTDIEGSTRLWEEAPEAMRPALARHDAMLREAIETQGGHVFKTMGDSFCAAFRTVPEALEAAVVAQRALLLQENQLRVRMAVHTGEAEARDGDYFGPALNRTARLLTAAHGGQVLLSQAAAEATRSSCGSTLGLRPLGRHQLRDIDDWEAVFQLEAPGLSAAFPPPNTLDVARRRGRLQGFSISAVVLAVILGLAWSAVRSEATARRLAEGRRLALLEARGERDRAADLLYVSQMNVAYLAVKEGKIIHARRLLDQYLPRPGQPDRRDFAWRLLWRLCRSDDRYTFPARAAEVTWVAVSPDGTMLAAVDAEGAVQLWNTPKKELLASVPAHQGAGAATFSPDGKLLATAGWEDGAVKLWDLSASPPLLRKQWPSFRRVRARPLFTPDGSTLIAGYDDASVRLWDIGSSAFRSIPTRAAGVMGLSPDGRTLAVCGAGKDAGRVTLWNIGHGVVTRVPRSLPPLGGMVESLAFSPGGRLLATGAAGRIVVWDAIERRPLRVLTGLDGPVVGLAFAPNGSILASGAFDGMIRLWDSGSGRQLAALRGHMARVTSVRFSPDGGTLISSSADRTVRLWNAGANDRWPGAAVRSQSEILTGGRDGVGGLAFSPDGRLLAVVRDESVSLWNASDRSRLGPPLWRRPGAGGGRMVMRRGCAFAPDGRLLAVGGFDGGIRVWDVAGRRRLFDLRGHPAAVSDLAFTSGGTLASGNGGGSTGTAARTIIWDLASRRPLGEMPGDPRIPLAPLAVSSDGALFAAGSPERQITLWRAPPPASGGGAAAPASRLEPVGGGEPFPSLAFSPDGKLIAAGSTDGTVYLWDRATGKRARSLVGHIGPALALAFSPDGRTLASGGMDRTVRLWNPAADQQEAALTGHRDLVWAVAFSPDGAILATGGPDGTVRLWRADGAPESGARP